MVVVMFLGGKGIDAATGGSWFSVVFPIRPSLLLVGIGRFLELPQRLELGVCLQIHLSEAVH